MPGVIFSIYPIRFIQDCARELTEIAETLADAGRDLQHLSHTLHPQRSRRWDWPLQPGVYAGIFPNSMIFQSSSTVTAFRTICPARLGCASSGYCRNPYITS